MTQEYPKMLYTGDKEQYSCRAVQDADEEQQYRDNGLVDYAELPDPEPKVKEVPQGEAPQGFVTTEQFDAVAEQLVAMKAEIERLKTSTPEPLFPEMKHADAVAEQVSGDEKSTNPDAEKSDQLIDYSDFTIPQLQAELDAKGIKYLARDSKDTLINLLG